MGERSVIREWWSFAWFHPDWSSARVGPRERHTRWGHWTEQLGHLLLLVFWPFPLFLFNLFSPPPFPTLSDQRVNLLFIYMSNCINKYTYNSFLILLTVITVINNFFLFSVYHNYNHCIKRHIEACYSFMYSCVSFQPYQCHAPHIPILNQVWHSRGVQSAQLP